MKHPFLLRALLIFSLVILLQINSIYAHQFDPVVLNIHQISSDVYEVSCKSPLFKKSNTPQFPKHCTPIAPLTVEIEKNYQLFQTVLSCPNPGLLGQSLQLPPSLGKEVILNINLINGTHINNIYPVTQKTFELPTLFEKSWHKIITQYIGMGFEHILRGWDHLLFLLALVILIENFKKLALIVSAFTLGHGLTITLASLKILTLPSPPVEAAIAASIMLVALRSVQIYRESFKNTNTRITGHFQNWSLVLLFGLAHGLGFAGALLDLGLPQKNIPSALLSFNIGVELGQLVFVLISSLIIYTIQIFSNSTIYSRINLFISYTIGCIGTFLFIQRISLFFH